MRKWSEEEVDILKQDYGTIPSKEVAKKLGRTKRSVWWKARSLGLRYDARSLNPAKNTKLVRGELTDFELGFIVGLIEGEGSISFSINKDKKSKIPYVYPHFTIAGKDLRLLKRAQQLIGGVLTNKRSGTHDLVLRRIKTIIETLKRLEPYLITKRDDARKVIKWFDLFTERRKTSPKPNMQEMELIKSVWRKHRDKWNLYFNKRRPLFQQSR